MRLAAACARRAASSLPAATFEEIGLGADLCRAMRQMGHDAPTEIQRAAIPHLLEGGDTVVGSHTGSGKSLAFMLPLIERQRRWEASASGGGRIKPRPQRPRSIILAPTRELVTQIVGVAKTVSRAAPFRVTSLVGGGGQKRQRSALHSAGVDMLVATPQQLQHQHAERKLFLTDLRTVVVDEADTMLSPKSGHADDVLALLNSARHMRARGGGGGGGDDRNSAASRDVQLIAVGATVSVLLFTVTLYANLAHSLTRSP
jgi:superfamily II DNA/RNA helicase